MSRFGLFCLLICFCLAGLSATALGQRNISADAYLDKARAMWTGQILGNYAGRGYVPGTTQYREGYIQYGGGDFDVGWSDVLSTSTWVADDDTSLEYMYLDLLKGNADPSPSDIKQTWTNNISAGSLYIANKQARWLMEPPPVGASLSPPQTGSIYKNIHWYAIDAQIATESIDYGPVMDLRIEWVDPNIGTQEQKDFWTYGHLLTAGTTGAQPGTKPRIMLSHQWESIPGGCKMRSCMHGAPEPPPGSGPVLPPSGVLQHPSGKKPTGGGWRVHNIAEVSTFHAFLPALWGIWQAVPDPTINRQCSLKIKKESSQIVYV